MKKLNDQLQPTDECVDPPRFPAAAFQNVVGDSEVIRQTVALGCRVAAYAPNTVLLHGETGTGKELFARGIHYSGEGGAEPFVAINCAAIPENLLESELFGHERGAFSGAHEQKRGLFEVAGGGTVFLDEIGELPIQLQPKLLRVLEERKIRRVGAVREIAISCRIVAATNRDLAQLSSEGVFRPDLYYRLSVVSIELPPLRERTGDIELLARFFVEQVAREHGLRKKKLAPETMHALRTYHWPGNVRELRNAIEGALVYAEGEEILPHHVLVRRRSAVPSPVTVDGRPVAATIPIPEGGITMAEGERRLIEATLRMVHYSQSETARILRISRPTLTRKIRRYHLKTKPEPEAGASG